MPSNYCDDLKREFFAKNVTEDYVRGVEYLSSVGLWGDNSFNSAVYILHKTFIKNSFDSEAMVNNPILINRFASAYLQLLKKFSWHLSGENKNDLEFKQVVTALIQSIISYDKYIPQALIFAEALIELDLPQDFCLNALTRIKLDGDSEIKSRTITILDALYSKNFGSSNASTPNFVSALTPTTPPSILRVMHQVGTKYYSQYANNAEISFLFYLQSCWLGGGNHNDCNFIDDYLTLAVASLLLNPEKIPQWNWVLDTLKTYPAGSMQSSWRLRIIEELKRVHNGSEILNHLNIKEEWHFSSLWMPFFRCMDEDTKDYQSEPVISRRKLLLE